MELSRLPFLPVSELAGLIESKEVSPVEATQAYLERIESVDSKINSYITVCREEALEAAQEAEGAILKGNYLGPMHGIPIAVKDQIFTKGIRTTAGSTILWDFVPEEDATVITNLREAGAVLLGKLNLSEFARGGNFYHPAGTPRNPWNLDHNPGFSSSGSGAATAAFLCATSLGEDTGGSTRIPAAFCGMVGLRPTWGRVSRYGVLPVSWSMDAVGPISRTAEDCAITLGVIAGYDSKDPYTWQMPVPDYREGLNGDIKGIKVGVLKEGVDADGLHPEIRDAVLKAVDVLEEAGVILEEVSIPLVEQAGTFSQVHRGYRRGRTALRVAQDAAPGLRPEHTGAALDGLADPSPGLLQGPEVEGASPATSTRCARDGGRSGAARHAFAAAQAHGGTGHQQEASRSANPRPNNIHRAIQSGQHSRPCGPLRLHL